MIRFKGISALNSLPSWQEVNKRKREKEMNVKDWKWLNESQIINENGEIVIYAPEKTDWFNNPIPEADGSTSKPVANAPFYYTDVEGDFVFSVKVRPNHKFVYDACAIMCIEDEYVWMKAAFE